MNLDNLEFSTVYGVVKIPLKSIVLDMECRSSNSFNFILKIDDAVIGNVHLTYDDLRRKSDGIVERAVYYYLFVEIVKYIIVSHYQQMYVNGYVRKIFL